MDEERIFRMAEAFLAPVLALYAWWHEPINDEPWQVTHGAVVMGHIATAILFGALLAVAVCDALVIYSALYGGMR